MKKTLAIILSIIMLISVCPVAFAADSVSYVNRSWNETTNAVVSETKTVDTYTVVNSSTTTMSSGWYVVNSNVTVADRITVSGTVNLILCDGYTLTASKGIYLASGNSLTIYGQANDSGALSATATTSEDAGIGGKFDVDSGTLIICGGNVTAKGAVDAAGIGGGYWSSNGIVSIYGGTVTANGGSGGAGIGGGKNDSGRVKSSGGNISIYGGTVTANSGKSGAGIGGGLCGPAGSISIYGGTVTATATGTTYECGAGIGGGENENSSTCAVTGTISIHGGNVTAKATGGYGAGIGGGAHGTVDAVTITGGIVTATGGQLGAGIGSGNIDPDDKETIKCGTVTITGGTVTATGGQNSAGIGGGRLGSGGTVIITGGSVSAVAGSTSAENIGKGYNGISSGTLTNGTANVSKQTLTLSGAANVNIASMSGLSGYGLKDVKTDANGKLYFYLPANTALPTSLTTADGTIFSNNGSGNYTEHVHSFADATCTEPKTCSCGITEGSALGHDWSDNNGICKNDNTHLCNHAGYETSALCGTCGKTLHQHSYTYTANGSVITATCVGEGTCPDNNIGGTVTISAEDANYSGSAIETASLTYSDNWVGATDLTITYENNVEVGMATASVTVEEATATANFYIVADLTEADMLVKSLEGRIDNLTLTDSANALFAEYKATLDTYKADKLTSQSDVDALVANLKAFDEAIKDKSAIAPDFSELEEAYRTLTTVMHENLTDEAEAKLEEVLADYESAKASANQKELIEVQAAVIDAMIDFVNEVIDNDYVKADYTAVDTAFAALVAPEGEELTAEAVAAIAKIKAVIDTLKAEDTSETELDAADDAILADIAEVAAAIADTSYLKADYTEIDAAMASIVVPENETLTDEAAATVEALEAAIAKLKSEDTSKTELAAAAEELLYGIDTIKEDIESGAALKADFTALDEEIASLVAPEGEAFTDEAAAYIDEFKDYYEEFKSYDPSKKDLERAAEGINDYIDAIKEAIADGSYLKADYTALDEAFAALVAPEGEELTDDMKAAIEEIKAAIDALKAEDTSKTELDEADDAIYEDIAAVEVAIITGEGLKADTTVADELLAEIDAIIAEGKFDDEEALAKLEELRAEIEAIKADGNASKAEYQARVDELTVELEAVYQYCQECENCGRIHTTNIHEYICILIRLIKLVVSLIQVVAK